MSNLLTLSVILFGIALVGINCGPAPPVTQLYFHPRVYKAPNGHTKFYYYQKGYDESVYVSFNGRQLRSECKIYRTDTDIGRIVIGWWHECLVKGTNGVVIIKTAFGSIYGRNYNKMSFSY